jgi:hypothetical protein
VCLSVLWDNFTLTNSNKIENIQIKFSDLCYYLFFQSDIIRINDLIVSLLNFRTLYFGHHLDALFLINVFKVKINCHYLLETVGIRVHTRQIREFPTFRVGSASKHSPSARCVIAAKDVCRVLDFKKCFLQGHFLGTINCLHYLYALNLIVVAVVLVVVVVYLLFQCR